MTVNAGALLGRARKALADASLPNAGLDAAVLLCHAAGLTRETLIAYPERDVADGAVAHFHAMVERRLAREPVSRILGAREFWGLCFAISEATLDPRPDSETLVEAALEIIDTDMPATILDLGTGSGCLLLALLSERPNAFGVGIDLSPGAVQTATENARALGLADRAAFVCGSWADAVGDAVADLVISNPPYISRADLAVLEPEVAQFDPIAALDGGADGLDAYRAIVPVLPRILRTGGMAIFEVGQGQSEQVGQLLSGAGLSDISTRPDLAGIARCVVGR